MNAAARRHPFAPRGPLALDPRAYGAFFDVASRDGVAPPVKTVDGVAIVDITGPLMHHESWWCDSYDAIAGRVDAALKESPRALLLNVDSPGGLVAGLFDTAARIRRACDAANVPLVAYIDGQATSAAYALACVADHITAPATAVIGSIGVIDALMDARGSDAQFGLAFTLVASGARKTDGNPHAATTDDAIAATRANVDALANLFFAHVAAYRGIDPAAIKGLEAGVMIGGAAVAAGLVDDIGTLETTLAGIVAGAIPPTTTTTSQETEAMKPTTPAATPSTPAAGPIAGSKKYEEAIAILRKAAEGEDDEAKKAKRMLAAELAGDDGGEEEPDGDEAPSTPPPAKEDDGEAKKALRAAQAALAAAESSERATLIATRPDLAPEVVADLEKAPLATVRALVKSLPRTARAPAKPVVDAVVTGTRGATQGGAASHTSPEQKALIDRAMGMTATKRGVVNDGIHQIFGAEIPVVPGTEPAPAARK